MLGKEQIAPLRANGYSVEPSKAKVGRFRWFRETGSDGLSVPKREVSETTYESEDAAWDGAAADNAILQGANEPKALVLHYGDILMQLDEYLSRRIDVGDSQATALRSLMQQLMPTNDAEADDVDLAPVHLGERVEFLPVARDKTPSFLVVVKDNTDEKICTDDPNGDRVTVGAVSLDEALGIVLRQNPRLRYEDILDHMEV